MPYETLYLAINLMVLPAWLALILAPRWSGTRAAVHSALYPLVMGLLYMVFFITRYTMDVSMPGGNFSSAAGISALFAHPHGVIIGWTHYLVFDLFAGAWIGRDALRRGVTHWLVVPCLLATCILGPVGMFFYLAARALTGKGGWSLFEDKAG